MLKVRKKIYTFFNYIIALWTVGWLYLIFKNFSSKNFSESFFLITPWISGLFLLLLIQRFVKFTKTSLSFYEFKIRKIHLLLGFLLYIFFIALIPYLLTQAPQGYQYHYNFVIIAMNILFFSMLFEKMVTFKAKEIVLHPVYSKTQLIIFSIFLFATLCLIYCGSPVIPDISLVFLGTVLIIFAFLKRNRFEFNCPYCFRILKISFPPKIPYQFECNYCKKKIKIELCKENKPFFGRKFFVATKSE